MKKNLLITCSVAFALLFTISSCTKEQMALNKLHGDWKFVSQLDQDGVLETPSQGVSTDMTVTFFDCSTKNTQQNCNGTTQTVTTRTNGSTTTTSYSSGTFSYQVEENTQLLANIFGGGNTVYIIEKLDKKTLAIHPFDQPKATTTFNKK